MENQANSKACTNTVNALTVPFSFTHGISSWPPVAGKEFIIEGDSVKKVVHGSIASGVIRNVKVKGLLGFAEYIAGFGEADFVINGTSPALADGLAHPLCTAKKPVSNGVARTRENFPFFDSRFKAFIDFDAPSDVPCPDHLERLARVVEIYPPFADVGFCIRPSASCGIYREGELEPGTRTGGERWDFLFKSGLDVGKFVEEFKQRAWLAGYGHVNIDKGGSRHLTVRLDKNTEIDLSVFQPERIDFCGSNPTREGVRRKKWSPIFIDGGCLELVEGLSPLEVAQAEMLMQAALEAAWPEAKQIADERRRELGKAAAKKISGSRGSKVEKSVVGTLERHAEAKSQSRTGLPVVYATLGQTLNFVGIDEVDAVDVLRNPESFIECTCDDPLEPEKGAKGIFYTGKHRQIFSFANYGYLLRLVKVDIVFDHENPVDTMDEVDAVLRAGKFPDLFERGGEIVKVSRTGQIKPIGKENLPIEVSRLVKFNEWKQSRDGAWSLVPMSPSVSWWLAYSN
jgi:hypothetical protein